MKVFVNLSHYGYGTLAVKVGERPVSGLMSDEHLGKTFTLNLSVEDAFDLLDAIEAGLEAQGREREWKRLRGEDEA